MCGIAGYLCAANEPPLSESVLPAMVHALRRRGPDAQAAHIDGHAGLGHARLSIIDLAGGGQPLCNETGDVAVVANGEIYNYRELSALLRAGGHQFRTGSDCETLVHLWEEEGPEMVSRLRGMFAFVLYDRRRNILFGARDRFGQKPLFYTEKRTAAGAGYAAFASEVKSLLALPDIDRTLDLTALDQFLFYQFVPQPRTMFESIRQIPPAHWFLYDPAAQGANRLRIERYWAPAFAVDDSLTDEEHLAHVEAAVEDAVASHMVSDVPVGVFLSGGIDSSLITALAARHSPEALRTFSIAFVGSDHDESAFAKQVSAQFGTRHSVFPFVADDIAGLLAAAAKRFDQPLADSAALPLLFLSERAAEHVKVVLTGDGGDELFGGYRKYKRAASTSGQWLHRLTPHWFSVRKLAACCADSLGLRRLQARVGLALAPTRRSAYQRRHWEGWDRYALYSPELRGRLAGDFAAVDEHGGGDLAAVNAMLRIDQGAALADDLLWKTDQATMAHGLEARAPLLDHQLAAVAGRLPIRLKVTPSETKVALRWLARRLLPAEVAGRKKQGFSFPIGKWFRGPLRAWAEQLLVHDSTLCERYFRREHIARVLAEHQAGRDHAGRIYSLAALELWHREFAG